MSERQFQTDSHHPNAKNIMGGVGCLTADGKRCNACCGKFYNIKDFKPPGQVCRYVNSTGCSVHAQIGQPVICKEYHCNELLGVISNPLLPEETRGKAVLIALSLINQAHRMGIIDESGANHAEKTIKSKIELLPSYSIANSLEE
ncbi:hypothetical protein A2125_00180 [Candidatus Woesebacteria bacterium GWB1_43_5]|uniref:Uncharacterized protein n=1 Tax=Candidatus Woesebacteria bacterium GWB1_43_5 TaxID=1802474 RepID=A0A1F7WSR8_9BACT|nr:MAG: hypothetical protein A2125_00180 [Candidatus Woesebacteria bacterium GWB1_43_5]